MKRKRSDIISEILRKAEERQNQIPCVFESKLLVYFSRLIGRRYKRFGQLDLIQADIMKMTGACVSVSTLGELMLIKYKRLEIEEVITLMAYAEAVDRPASRTRDYFKKYLSEISGAKCEKRLEI